MPNWKYPCFECKGPVKSNQRGLQCHVCKIWVHLKCTEFTEAQYNFLEVNEDIPFFCLSCKPRLLYADEILEDTSSNTNLSSADPSPNLSSTLNSDSDYEFSDAHSSDFELVDDSDSEGRGLNFNSLPVQNPDLRKNNRLYNHRKITVQTRNYKHPCVVCLGPCKNNCQDSICCTLCDEWTHQKCSNLTLDQFQKYCLPENSEIPYWCDNCLYGSRKNLENQSCLSASEIESLDTNDIYNLCPNSIFRDKDEIPTTEYFTTDELNVEIRKTPENIRLIHINAVSLCKHIISITDMIAGLEKLPSIIFISETRADVMMIKRNFKKIKFKLKVTN